MPRGKQLGFLSSEDAFILEDTGSLDFLGSNDSGGGGTDWGNLDLWDAAFWDAFLNFGGNSDAAAAYADAATEAACAPGSICLSTSEPGAVQLPPSPNVNYPYSAQPPTPDFSNLSTDLSILGSGGASPALPGYCSAGTYHPATDPFACVPFPDDPTLKKAAQAKAAQQNAAAKKAAQAKQPCPPGQGRYPVTGQCVPLQCPTGTVRNPATGQCVASQCAPGLYLNPTTKKCDPLPACPSGKVFDLRAGQCVTPNAGFSFSDIPTWAWGALLVLLAGITLSATNDQSAAPKKRRRAA